MGVNYAARLHRPVSSGGNAMGLSVTWQLERLGGETFMVSREFARAAYLGFW